MMDEARFYFRVETGILQPDKKFPTTSSGNPQVTIIQDVCEFLDSFAPLRLAEEWDNVGLLVGDTKGEVHRLMTCLTVTPETAQEAIDQNVELVVSHHPLPFRPLKRVTTDNIPAKLLWDLIRSGVFNLQSPHRIRFGQRRNQPVSVQSTWIERCRTFGTNRR